MNSYGQGRLDDIWRSGGELAVRRAFSGLASEDGQKAIEYINDKRLGFPVFFILVEDILKYRLTDYLSPRQTVALHVCTRKRMASHQGGQPVLASEQHDEELYYGTLRWMLDTGLHWDGPSGYDAVIDYATALVIAKYKDKAILSDIAELIFRRNRRGRHIHDLVWSFFQTIEPDALAVVADYLKSSNSADAALATTLIGAQDGLSRGLEWIRDNRAYLYLTGEHLQMTSRPRHFDCDLEAKYLDKEIMPHDRAPVAPLTEDEIDCLYRYRAAPSEEQGLLAEYSHRLRCRDRAMWQAWLRQQIAEQVIAARTLTEGEAV